MANEESPPDAAQPEGGPPSTPRPDPPGASPPPGGPPPGAPPSEGGAGEEESPRIIPSDEIFHGEREVHIVHGGVVYRLLITKTGKLLLHK